jgi:5-methylcytosine-specific restriction endonuclease McrA
MDSSGLEGLRVLVLNSSYEPIRVVSWQRAVVLMLADKVDVLEHHDSYAHSPSTTLRLPSVIKLQAFVQLKRFRRVAKFSREHVFLRDGHKCQYCSKTFSSKELTLDHVVPVKRGGKKTWSNIVTSCSKCNQKKGSRTPQEAGFHSFRWPKEPSPSFLPDLLYYKERMPDSWRQYLPLTALSA